MFLKNIKLEQYLGNLVENGYDDFKFMLTMNESEVFEMLEDASIEKEGHIKKFIAALNIYKCNEIIPVLLRKVTVLIILVLKGSNLFSVSLMKNTQIAT